MANIITVSASQLGTTPPSKAHNISVYSILDIQDWPGTAYPFQRSVIFTNNPVLNALYCNEQASTIKALANAPLA
jgi:hypothetical protein